MTKFKPMKNYLGKLMAHVKTSASGCWEWQRYCEPGGYGRTRYLGANTLVHRMSWVLHMGAIPDGASVLHKCDNRRCCNPDHLFLGDAKENAADAMVKGRLDASLANLAKVTCLRRVRLLTDAQVSEILTSNESSASLASRMGCSYQNVYLIRRGKRKIAPMRVSA